MTASKFKFILEPFSLKMQIRRRFPGNFQAVVEWNEVLAGVISDTNKHKDLSQRQAVLYNELKQKFPDLDMLAVKNLPSGRSFLQLIKQPFYGQINNEPYLIGTVSAQFHMGSKIKLKEAYLELELDSLSKIPGAENLARKLSQRCQPSEKKLADRKFRDVFRHHRWKTIAVVGAIFCYVVSTILIATGVGLPVGIAFTLITWKTTAAVVTTSMIGGAVIITSLLACFNQLSQFIRTQFIDFTIKGPLADEELASILPSINSNKRVQQPDDSTHRALQSIFPPNQQTDSLDIEQGKQDEKCESESDDPDSDIVISYVNEESFTPQDDNNILAPRS